MQTTQLSVFRFYGSCKLHACGESTTTLLPYLATPWQTKIRMYPGCNNTARLHRNDYSIILIRPFLFQTIFNREGLHGYLLWVKCHVLKETETVYLRQIMISY